MIYPRCKSIMNQVYISAEGIVYPCCWFGCEPEASDYKKFHGENIKALSATQVPLQNILADTHFLKVEKSWSTEKPYPLCQQKCSEPIPQVSEHSQGANTRRSYNLRSKDSKQ